MAIGPIVKKIVGPSLARQIGAIYRSIFVDLDEVATALATHIPPEGEILDIGGGDGELLNKLLRRLPKVQVTMIDISSNIGSFLDQDLRARVTVRPSTTLKDYLQSAKKLNCIMINDVLHHISQNERNEFLQQAHSALLPNGKLIIKEFAPGGFRSLLGLLADRYISGDRKVSFISQSDLETLVKRAIPVSAITATDLFAKDRPNYALVFSV